MIPKTTKENYTLIIKTNLTKHLVVSKKVSDQISNKVSD